LSPSLCLSAPAASSSSNELEIALSKFEARAFEPFHYLVKEGGKLEGGKKLETPTLLEASEIAGYYTYMQFSDSSCNDYTYSAGLLLNYCSYDECTYPDYSTGFCSDIYTCDGSTVTVNTYYSQNCTGVLKSSSTNTASAQCINTGGYNLKYACKAAKSGAPLPSDSYVVEFYDDSSCSQQPLTFYGIANGLCQSDSNATLSCDSNGVTYTQYNNSECSVAPKSYPQTPFPVCFSADDGDDPAKDDTYVMARYAQITCTSGSGSSSSKNGLSAGAIAGIAIGTTAVVAAIGFGVYYWLFKYRLSVLDTTNNKAGSIKQNPMSSTNEL
jgi:hypothetical protein